jgi:hypothetical protein
MLEQPGIYTLKVVQDPAGEFGNPVFIGCGLTLKL